MAESTQPHSGQAEFQLGLVFGFSSLECLLKSRSHSLALTFELMRTLGHNQTQSTELHHIDRKHASPSMDAPRMPGNELLGRIAEELAPDSLPSPWSHVTSRSRFAL